MRTFLTACGWLFIIGLVMLDGTEAVELDGGIFQSGDENVTLEILAHVVIDNISVEEKNITLEGYESDSVRLKKDGATQLDINTGTWALVLLYLPGFYTVEASAQYFAKGLCDANAVHASTAFSRIFAGLVILAITVIAVLVFASLSSDSGGDAAGTIFVVIGVIVATVAALILWMVIGSGIAGVCN